MNNKLKRALQILPMLLFGFILLSNGQSRPAEREQKQVTPQQTTKIKMSVEGMSCMACVANVKKTIEEVEGVQQVEVSLQQKQAIVTYVSSAVKPEKIQEAVNKRGFKAGKPETQKR